MAKIKVGDALAQGTDIGPVSSESQLEQDLDYIEIGQGEGATLAAGGERLKLDTEGFYMSPALFSESAASMRINKEEIFGPVASVIRVEELRGGAGHGQRHASSACRRASRPPA